MLYCRYCCHFFQENSLKLHFKISLGFALLDHVFKSVKVAASLDCAMDCTASSKCKSFNFNLSESVQNNCHLNDATRSTSSPSNYKESSGLTYYEATRLVSSNNLYMLKRGVPCLGCRLRKKLYEVLISMSFSQKCRIVQEISVKTPPNYISPSYYYFSCRKLNWVSPAKR